MPTIRAFSLTTDRSGTASRAAAAAVAARRPIARLSEARARSTRAFADDMLSAAADTWDDRQPPPGRPAHATARAAASARSTAGARHALPAGRAPQRTAECSAC